MTRLSTAIDGIHIPTFVVVFIASLLTQFTLSMNGQLVDPTTNEGRANIISGILLLLIKAIQLSTATKPIV